MEVVARNKSHVVEKRCEVTSIIFMLAAFDRVNFSIIENRLVFDKCLYNRPFLEKPAIFFFYYGVKRYVCDELYIIYYSTIIYNISSVFSALGRLDNDD